MKTIIDIYSYFFGKEKPVMTKYDPSKSLPLPPPAPDAPLDFNEWVFVDQTANGSTYEVPTHQIPIKGLTKPAINKPEAEESAVAPAPADLTPATTPEDLLQQAKTWEEEVGSFSLGFGFQAAFHLYQQAAALGNLDGMLNLALAHALRRGVQQDLEKARELLMDIVLEHPNTPQAQEAIDWLERIPAPPAQPDPTESAPAEEMEDSPQPLSDAEKAILVNQWLDDAFTV